MAIVQPPPNPPAAAKGPRRLVFAGEAIVDVALRVPALPAPGADVLADASQITPGGGFNVMAAAARQGLPVLYAGGHGTGPWGDLVRKALAAEGVGVLREPDPLRDTGFAVALATPDGERTYVTRLGAESRREPGCLDQVPVTGEDAVYISGYGLIGDVSGPVVAAWVMDLPPGAVLFLDPGPLAARIPAPLLEQVLPRCDWLSCTAAEAALLAGIADPADAARALASRTRNVIVRTGETGCLLCEPPAPGQRPAPGRAPGPYERPADTAITVATGRSYGGDALGGGARGGALGGTLIHVPAPAVTAVDTTGAGDAHAGAFLAALAEGLPAEAAARRANAAAALAVTRPGPATAPTRAELDAWLR